MNYKSVVAKQLDDSAVQYCNLNSKHYKKYIIIQKKSDLKMEIKNYIEIYL